MRSSIYIYIHIYIHIYIYTYIYIYIYIYTYIEGPTLQLRYCLTCCSIATVACIWYIGFLPPTLFGASCRCNFLSVVSLLGSMTRNVVDLSQLLLAFFKLRIAKNIFDRYLTIYGFDDVCIKQESMQCITCAANKTQGLHRIISTIGSSKESKAIPYCRAPGLAWSRDHPRTQIQITCTRRDLFLALRSSAHAADNHMYTQVSPTITCTRK